MNNIASRKLWKTKYISRYGEKDFFFNYFFLRGKIETKTFFPQTLNAIFGHCFCPFFAHFYTL